MKRTLFVLLSILVALIGVASVPPMLFVGGMAFGDDPNALKYIANKILFAVIANFPFVCLLASVLPWITRRKNGPVEWKFFLLPFANILVAGIAALFVK